jgi:hypothetical protein
MIEREHLRTAIIVLVFANAAFATWALLVDRPVVPPAARDISHLPRLVLASEPAAQATPARCVTVGPFSDLATAATAAALLQSRGFTPTQRDEAGANLTVYWVNINLTSPGQSVSTEGLLPAASAGGHLEIRDCPASAASAPNALASSAPAAASSAPK